MLTSIVGINWGDEGKGRMVDLFASEYDAVIRYQGGNNAGHTVVNDKGKFIFNLLPSGILSDNAVNIMGNGMVIDLEHLNHEIEELRESGIEVSQKNLKISDKAVVCMPYNKLLDGLEEDRLGKNAFGSTRRGIAPVYSDKYMKKAIRVGDLLDMDNTKKRLKEIVEWKNLTVEKGYGHEPVNFEEMYDWLVKYGTPIIPHITDTTVFLRDYYNQGKDMLFEAQLGALKDIDFGIYPFTSSSNTIAAYGPIGAGVPQLKLDNVLGVMKAYSSAVGAGPFVCELFGEEGDKLREAGGEYGAATGRPRRVGGFDVVASRYGVRVQGATSLALTKLDVLNDYDKIPICIAYEVDGERIEDFPTDPRLDRAKPIYEYLDGWKEDISGIRKAEDLPKECMDYVKELERLVNAPIQYISVGPERDAYIKLF